MARLKRPAVGVVRKLGEGTIQVTIPHNLNQADSSDLVRDLNMPKQKAELLSSRLQQWNLLLPAVKVTDYRTREKNLLHFFDKKENVVVWIDVNRIFNRVATK
ncbi:hypothetical protein TNCV_1305021 [Trichonephila clavipes]|nr:hypothetical protein TNCV_1305021 [Trichonephila clavipes]